MKVKELITKLLECSMDAEVVIQKELDYNIWVNSNVIISENTREAVVLDFNFPSEKFTITRKNS